MYSPEDSLHLLLIIVKNLEATLGEVGKEIGGASMWYDICVIENDSNMKKCLCCYEKNNKM